MSRVSSPLNFADLKAASVYYEILNCDPTKLRSIALEERFEKNADGTMVYYNIFSNGGYARARGNCGEFVKMTTDDGREVFLHFSQVFGPTWAARQKMDTLAYVLGAAYQNTHRQMAMLNDLINEAAALNESMRKFNDIYSSFAANALNYDSSAPNQRLRIEPWLLQLYIDNGLRFPAGGICDGLMPQIYVRINQDNIAMAYHADWDFFFINNTGASPEQTVLWSHRVQYSPHTFVPNAPKPAPTHTFNECLESMKIREIMSNAQLMEKQFSSPAKYKLQAYTSEGVRLAFNLHTGIFYAKCKFDMAGNMSYEYFFGLNDPPSSIDYTKPYELYPIEDSGYDIDVSACCYSRTTSIDAVLGGNSIGCFSQKEVNAFLDQIRIAIDQLNNKLSVVSTTLGMYNQDLQQNYSVATSALDATEEAQQKTAKNIR